MGVVEQFAEETEPEAFYSNAAMQMRTGAALEVAEAKLNQALKDLQLLMREGEWEALEKAQEAWQQYREALQNCAHREYEGGTHAPLAWVFAGLAETERRTAEICEEVKDRTARYG